jgi:predicted PurR-regulated permease PerM
LIALTVATIRSVAQGVIGVAFIQALVVGLCLFVADVPLEGVLSAVVLVLGIAQIPALIVVLPAIAYLWLGGHHSTLQAALYSALLLVAGLIDNLLKPLLLGRGVDAPMPVILLGALGGMATAGIMGMFLGATLLAVGYRILMEWVAPGPHKATPPNGGDGTRVV